MQGIIEKYYKRPKKTKLPYGFITGYDGESYYFNSKNLLSDINIGDEVSFKGRRNEKGFVAFEVKAIK